MAAIIVGGLAMSIMAGYRYLKDRKAKRKGKKLQQADLQHEADGDHCTGLSKADRQSLFTGHDARGPAGALQDLKPSNGQPMVGQAPPVDAAVQRHRCGMKWSVDRFPLGQDYVASLTPVSVTHRHSYATIQAGITVAGRSSNFKTCLLSQ